MLRSAAIFALAMSVSTGAMAAAVGLGNFTSPSVSQPEFNTFGSNALTFRGAPFTLGIATYTSSDGSIEIWSSGRGAAFLDCIGGCVTNIGAKDLKVSLDQAYGAIGLYVGQATSYSLKVSFFGNSNNLLGTEDVSETNIRGGLSFVGWSDIGGVRSVEIDRLVANNFFVAAASIYTAPFPASAAPEPSTWAMMLLGFAGLGFASYRSSRNRATA